jgi:hypothetical protein
VAALSAPHSHELSPGAQQLNILDRFPIVAKMNGALDQVHADEARRMKQSGYQRVLRKTRWCLLKRKQNLTSQHCQLILNYFRANKALSGGVGEGLNNKSESPSFRVLQGGEDVNPCAGF